MGVIVQKDVQRQISRGNWGTEVFLDNFFVSKDRKLINVQKQLDLSQQICLSSFTKRKGTQNTP